MGGGGCRRHRRRDLSQTDDLFRVNDERAARIRRHELAEKPQPGFFVGRLTVRIEREEGQVAGLPERVVGVAAHRVLVHQRFVSGDRPAHLRERGIVRLADRTLLSLRPLVE